MRVPANLRLTPQHCLSATHPPNPAYPRLIPPTLLIPTHPPPNTAYLRFIPLTLLISNSFPNPANLRLFP